MVFRPGGLKMDIRFKPFPNKGLNNYLFVNMPVNMLEQEPVNINFHKYLLLASQLTAGLSCFVLTRYSPFLYEVLQGVQPTMWRYNVIADDFQGLGTDLGFTLSHRLKNGNAVKEQSAYFPLKDLLTLRSFPEDTFGDKSSDVTLFALKPGSDKEISSFLCTDRVPYLPELLLENEIFIHISCSKSSGYYDTVLIKSVRDLTTKLMVSDQ
jgi:hypothetical protein